MEPLFWPILYIPKDILGQPAALLDTPRLKGIPVEQLAPTGSTPLPETTALSEGEKGSGFYLVWSLTSGCNSLLVTHTPRLTVTTTCDHSCTRNKHPVYPGCLLAVLLAVQLYTHTCT